MLPPAKAGIGSVVNDATREAGGALGVAVIGSVFNSVYQHQLAGSPLHALPPAALAAARDSVGVALALARNAVLAQSVTNSFMDGLHFACVMAAAVCFAGAVAAVKLPGRQQRAVDIAISTPAHAAEPVSEER